MEEVKEVEQRVLNTLGVSKSRFAIVRSSTGLCCEVAADSGCGIVCCRSPRLDTPVRIDIFMESDRRSARSPRQLMERWSVSLVKRCRGTLQQLRVTLTSLYLFRFVQRWWLCDCVRLPAIWLQETSDSYASSVHANQTASTVGSAKVHVALSANDVPCTMQQDDVRPFAFLRNAKLHYEISTAEVTELCASCCCTRVDPFLSQSVTHFDEQMTEFQFGSQETPLGTMYLSVWYRRIAFGTPAVSSTTTAAAEGTPAEGDVPVVGSDLINSEYFRDQPSVKLERKSSAPIPIASETRDATDGRQQRASSLPVQQHFLRQGATAPFALQETDEEDRGMLMNAASDLGSPVSFQPHSLPTRFGTDLFGGGELSGAPPFRPPGSRSRGGSVDHNIVSPVLSMSGVAQPMDIPVGKMRRAGSRNSLDEPSLGSSRGTSPSSFGSSFGSSPHNMFAFTPPFASGMATTAPTTSPAIESDGAAPLTFAGPGASGSHSVKSTGASSFKAFAETSLGGETGGDPAAPPTLESVSTTSTSRVFADQSAPSSTSTMFGQFSTEDLPFADPAGPEDNDTKIGSFVEDCWNAPSLSMFTGGNGQRRSQSTKALVETMEKLRVTKNAITAK